MRWARELYLENDVLCPPPTRTIKYVHQNLHILATMAAIELQHITKFSFLTQYCTLQILFRSLQQLRHIETCVIVMTMGLKGLYIPNFWQLQAL